MGIVLRTGMPPDAIALAPLAAETFQETWTPVIGPELAQAYATEHLTAERLAAEMADPENWYNLAVDEATGKIAGYVRLDAVKAGPEYLPDGTPMCLQRLYVAAEYRGAGIADLLLDACEAEAGRRGGDALWLETDPTNERAWRFYLKRGFVEVGYTVYQLPGGYNDNVRVLVRPLTIVPRTPSR